MELPLLTYKVLFISELRPLALMDSNYQKLKISIAGDVTTYVSYCLIFRHLCKLLWQNSDFQLIINVYINSFLSCQIQKILSIRASEFQVSLHISLPNFVANRTPNLPYLVSQIARSLWCYLDA